MSRVEGKRVQVEQVMYEGFGAFDEAQIATATEWWNGEGIDIHIQRKHMSDIDISLTFENISLLRKIFSDFDL